MTKKEKLKLLNAHKRQSTLTVRLFTTHPGTSQHFPDWKMDIYNLDDEIASYTCFLDNVKNKEDLIQGLTELKPFADDALEVACKMSDDDFITFKRELISERQGKSSNMPPAYLALVLPDKIMQAIILAQKAAAPLGAALIRILEVELGV